MIYNTRFKYVLVMHYEILQKNKKELQMLREVI